MSRWSNKQDLFLCKLVKMNIVNYTNLKPNYLFDITQEHFPTFIGQGPTACSTAIQRLRKKLHQLIEEFVINRGMLSGESLKNI